MTTSSIVKEALEQELEAMSCRDFTLDEVFGLTPVIEEKYCCQRDPEFPDQPAIVEPCTDSRTRGTNVFLTYMIA